MAPLDLLRVYDMKRANICAIRKRRLERRKIGRKVAICVAAALLAVSWLTVGFRYGMMFNSKMGPYDTLNVDFGEAEPWKRKLSSSAGCDAVMELKSYYVVLQTVGLFYFFLGLAVVCDEYFQMALEAISMSLKLTPDVAGATFLAAGSSAPELFTALADTFNSNNSIGTGTIVGSAIFNILVIVALSAIVAGKGGVWLDVDWRPICRDVSFYSYSIGLLVITFLDHSITLLEACIMVSSYFVYVVFMKYNAFILGKCKSHKVDDVSSDRVAIERAEMALGSMRKSSETESGFSSTRRASLRTMGIRHRQGSFQSEHLTPSRRMSQTMGVRHRPDKYRRAWKEAIVAIIAAQKFSAHRTWEWADEATTSARTTDTSADIENGIPKVDPCSSNTPIEAWSEESDIEAEDKRVQDEQFYVADHNTLDVLQSVTLGTSASLITEVIEEEETNDDEQSRFAWPDSCFDRMIYVLSFPYPVLFAITIPDCGKESETYWLSGKRITIAWPKLYMATFFMSILWIAILTYFMVEWASNLGCKLKISPVIMGVVFLAAGTSVPDAIGSMLAARDGEADMAIANAIGSNVFDILLGLGIPWVLSNIYYGKPVVIDKDGLTVNIIILACTVVLFVGVLIWNRWRINTNVGLVLFGLYFVFLVYCILNAVLSG